MRSKVSKDQAERIWKVDGLFETKAQQQARAPFLVVATDYYFNFTHPNKWHRVYHQTAGLACRHTTFVARRLAIKEEVREKIKKIHNHYYGTSLGGFQPSLDELISYQEKLKEIFANCIDCQNTYKYLQEGQYPIDPTQDALDYLVNEPIPNSLNDWVNWDDDSIDRMAGMVGRWRLLIIAPNSD